MAVAFVDTATKCLAIADSSAFFKNQRLAVLALVSVSCVVNVFETMTNKVVSGFKCFNVSEIWSPSTLLTKCTLR